MFFTTRQEIELLVRLKQLENCNLELEKWKLYGTNADLEIARERTAYNNLNKQYKSLDAVAVDLHEKYNAEHLLHEQTKIVLSDMTTKKNKWIKATFITGGASLMIITPLVYLLAH